jgi:hypothetical protein
LFPTRMPYFAALLLSILHPSFPLHSPFIHTVIQIIPSSSPEPAAKAPPEAVEQLSGHEKLRELCRQIDKNLRFTNLEFDRGRSSAEAFAAHAPDPRYNVVAENALDALARIAGGISPLCRTLVDQINQYEILLDEQMKLEAVAIEGSTLFKHIDKARDNVQQGVQVQLEPLATRLQVLQNQLDSVNKSLKEATEENKNLEKAHAEALQAKGVEHKQAITDLTQ